MSLRERFALPVHAEARDLLHDVHLAVGQPAQVRVAVRAPQTALFQIRPIGHAGQRDLHLSVCVHFEQLLHGLGCVVESAGRQRHQPQREAGHVRDNLVGLIRIFERHQFRRLLLRDLEQQAECGVRRRGRVRPGRYLFTQFPHRLLPGGAGISRLDDSNPGRRHYHLRLDLNLLRQRHRATNPRLSLLRRHRHRFGRGRQSRGCENCVNEGRCGNEGQGEFLDGHNDVLL